jgi:hypothetical protein
MTRLKFKGLTLCTLLALFAAGQAWAHTGVRDTVEEGKASYNGFTITHGCNNSSEGGPPAQQYPVIGQSAVFPIGDTAVWRDQTGAVIQVGGNGGGTIFGDKLSLSVTGYSDGSTFKTTEELVDGLGNVQGLFYKDGVMAPNLNAITPFKITAPTIANNCVKTLKIRIGVVNYCDTDKNAGNDAKGPWKSPKDDSGKEIKIPKTTSDKSGFVQANAANSGKFKEEKSNGDNNRADWWFTAPYGGSALYNDPDLLQPTYWTTLSVTNKAADLALCAGTQVEYTVEPSGVAFDTILTGSNTRPFTKGNQGL